MMEDLTKNIIFTTNAIGANGQPTTIQYQTADGTILKQPKIEGQKTEQPTFYYTTTNGGAATTVNLAQLTTDDNKTCYIAQPVGGYNYALVNGMQLNQGGTIGIATLDAQGRLQIVNQNKPIAASLQTISPIQNTISNISFKCDVCGLMFSHLALLNHHKRIHTQDGSDQQQQQQQAQPETIVLNAQGLVQTQNIITENGQMGQIQIVATEALEPATTVLQQQQQPQQQQQTNTVVTAQNSSNEVSVNATNISGLKSVKLTQSKCITCGNQMLQPAKRKGPKLVRCEDCIRSDQEMSAQQGITPTQIFVSQDGEIKCEINEFVAGGSTDSSPMDPLTAQGGILTHQLHPVQVVSENSPESQQQDNQQQNASTKHGQTSSQSGNHPVKKRNQQQVTKCQKCNGSGVVFVGTGTPATKQQAVNTKAENPKPFTCNICGGTFSRYSSLWSHKKLHSGEKNYKCTICGLAFAKAVYLKNHARIHTGEKPYKCQTCGMQFSQSPHLKNHERTHSGERPYVCEVCDKGFARHATLWNHRRIHTGEKPYKCEICGSAFSQAAHLKNHAKVHSGEKPFRCDICSAAFADRFALKRHRGIHLKYGQTAPRQPAQSQQQSTDSQTVMIHKQEITEMDDDAQHEVIISGL
ncbi:zinc finger protein 665 [Rhagoletis pomonella]|uniref:zinc finger protein 665 n=1 Tax=Rhagoletis pomonella TaxID=28610 RepID=UPI00177DCEC6|nr:zinc finger protein 665 [Rhagoletis pomonella]XP_036321674.1 zinc finger protein 665 [Rhagoletis pomonella]XP_036321675.1 zinc finger protein 665 [Rhagoletis pomonella]